MAAQIQVAGLATIKVCTTGGALATLGYSKDGVTISEHLYTDKVHGDENGGDVGPPIDEQYLGEEHDVRLVLTKYDETVLNTIRAGIAGGTAGTPGTSGTLYYQGSVYWRLLIHSVATPRNYICAIFTDAKEVNAGTKFSTAIVTAKCRRASVGAAIYNSTTS